MSTLKQKLTDFDRPRDWWTASVRSFMLKWVGIIFGVVVLVVLALNNANDLVLLATLSALVPIISTFGMLADKNKMDALAHTTAVGTGISILFYLVFFIGRPDLAPVVKMLGVAFSLTLPSILNGRLLINPRSAWWLAPILLYGGALGLTLWDLNHPAAYQ